MDSSRSRQDIASNPGYKTNKWQTLPSVCPTSGISPHPGIRCESAEPVFSQVQVDFRLSGTYTSGRMFNENGSPDRRMAVSCPVIAVFGFGHAFLVKFFASLQDAIVGIKLFALIIFLTIAASRISTHVWHWVTVAETLPPLIAWSTS